MALFINSFWKVPATPPASLLLDDYPGAILAMSLRKLRTAYTGSAIRVRRSSDNVEQDIGFVGEDLDTVSLLSFCGVSNGHVVTFYDQSGNGFDFLQPSAASQPLIVESGVLNVQGIKPIIEFASASLNFLRTTSAISNISSDYFITAVQRRDVNGFQYLLDTQTGRIVLDYSTTSWFTGTGGNATGTLTSYIGVPHLAVFNMKNGTGYVRRNGTTLLSSTPYNQRMIGVSTALGSVSSGGNNWIDGGISEFIIWNTDQDSNLAGIESNINTYYTLY